MEEILASIRKIISEDSTEQPPAAEAKPAPVAEAAPEPEPEPEADILDLTQVVDEPVAPAFDPPAPEPEPEPEPVLEAAPEQDVVFEPIEEEPVAEPAPAMAGNDIFSDKTRQSIDDAFAALDEPEAELAAAAPSPMRATGGGGSVEAVFENAVREAFEPVAKEWLGANAPQLIEKMKPLIREWMDEHFPALLEGAVREEVARVARSRGTKH
jgi:cell pole-organizing protein PopZ